MPGGLFWQMANHAAMQAAPAPVLLPGAVAFDAFTLSPTSYQATSPDTLAHTPVGTPRGVVVFVASGAGATDEVTGVTYGGVAMTRVAIATDTAVELGITYAYFLGSGIPTGTQNAVVTFDASAPNGIKVTAVYTFTGNNDLEVADFDVVQEDTASPVQVTLDPAGQSGIAVAGFWSGRADNTMSAPISGTTEDGSAPFSGTYHAVFGHTDPDTAAATIGWTTTATDDVAFVGVMVVDPGGVAPPPPPPDDQATIYAAAVLALNPQAYFPMLEGSGSTMTDASTNANNGTYNGSPTLGVAGPFSGATGVAFDGASQWAQAPHIAAYNPGTGDFSIVLWAKIGETWPSSTQWLIGHGGNGEVGSWEAYLRAIANSLQSRVAGVACNSDTADISTTGWHMIAFTADRDGNGVWYKDNVAAGSTSIAAGSATDISIADALFIARRKAGSYFAGSICQVAYFGANLSAGDIDDLWTAAGGA